LIEQLDSFRNDQRRTLHWKVVTLSQINNIWQSMKTIYSVSPKKTTLLICVL